MFSIMCEGDELVLSNYLVLYANIGKKNEKGLQNKEHIVN